MRYSLVALLAVACAGRSHVASRTWFEVGANSSLDGTSTVGSRLDVSRNDARVFVVRSNSASPLTEGFGLEARDGTYHVVFARAGREDIELLVLHADGSGTRMFANKRDTIPIRGVIHGDDVTLSGAGLDGATLQLPGGAIGSLHDGMDTVPVVFARFGSDTLIAIGWTGAQTQTALGHYDFARGTAETAGPHGAGAETFAAQP